MDYCGAGGDEGREGKGEFRILRDGIQVLQMYQAGKHGSTESVDEAGEVLFCGAWKS